MKINQSIKIRIQQFIFWAVVTCILLRIQKTIYEDRPLDDLSKSESTINTDEVKILQPDLNKSHLVPFHPFERGEPKMLVILSYQRSGSTFLSSFFNRNPTVFHMFEPLDSLYSSFYGTHVGWNVPSEITSYANGSERTLPENEIHGVSNFLDTLLSCDIDSLPTETLLHHYLNMFRMDHLALENYIQCVEKYKSLSLQCFSHAPRYCGNRFGKVSDETLAECYRILHDQEYRNKHKYRDAFRKYVMCTRSLKRHVSEKCSALLQNACQKRSLRVVKTVRATMASMEPLLQRLPNFRVIHLIRDPRAVLLSRLEFDNSAKALYSSADFPNFFAREAIVICRTIARDVRLRRELEEKYPGKIRVVIYDDLVKDLKGYTKNIYRFMGRKDPTNENWWRSSIGRLDPSISLKKSNNWERVITFKQNRDIISICNEFFEEVLGHDWW